MTGKIKNTISTSKLASWLAERTLAEASEAPEQWRVRNGSREARLGADRWLWTFDRDEDGLFPEDIPGELRLTETTFPCWVRRQTAGKIWLEAVSSMPPPETAEYGSIFIDWQAWAKKSTSFLEEMAKGERFASPLASESLQPESAASSKLTYVWSPPGSDWKEEAARLVFELVKAGCRVLVGGPTNNSVDEVLSRILKAVSESEAAIAPDRLMEGRVVRLGWSPLAVRVPISFDEHCRRCDGERTKKIIGLTQKISDLKAKSAEKQGALETWGRLELIRLQYNETWAERSQFQKQWSVKQAEVERLENLWREKGLAVKKAEKAWFGGERKRNNALSEYRAISSRLRQAEENLGHVRKAKEEWEERMDRLERYLAEVEDTCRGLNRPDIIQREIECLAEDLNVLNLEIETLRAGRNSAAIEVLNRALVVAGSLNAVLDRDWKDITPYDAAILVRGEDIDTVRLFAAAAQTNRAMTLFGDFPFFDFKVPTGRKDGGKGRTVLDFSDPGIRIHSLGDRVTVKQLTGQSRMKPGVARLVCDLFYGSLGLDFDDWVPLEVLDRLPAKRPEHWPLSQLLTVDTAFMRGWCGRPKGSSDPFNLASARIAVETARQWVEAQAGDSGEPGSGKGFRVFIGALSPIQIRLIRSLIRDLAMAGKIISGTPKTLAQNRAELVVLDTTLARPMGDGRKGIAGEEAELLKWIRLASRASDCIALVGDSQWLEKRIRSENPVRRLWDLFLDRGDRVDLSGANQSVDLIGINSENETNLTPGNIFGMIPLLEKEQWDRYGPWVGAALKQGARVTLITPSWDTMSDPDFADRAVRKLRRSGARVVPAKDYCGAEIMVDDRIWWSGEGCGGIGAGGEFLPETTALYADLIQADLVREQVVTEESGPRSCPVCGWPVLLINRPRPSGPWDTQPLKISCANKKCRKYIRNLDERRPFRDPPRCARDGITKYRRVNKGRAGTWQCPLHPDTCPRFQIVPGDPSQS